MNALRDKINSEVKEITSFYSPSLNRINQSIDSLQSIAEDFAVKFGNWLSEFYDSSDFQDNAWFSKDVNDAKEHKTSDLLAEFRDNFYSPNIKEGENKNS